jgi:hypothetical protein
VLSKECKKKKKKNCLKKKLDTIIYSMKVQFTVRALILLEYGVSAIYSFYYLLPYDICYNIL